MPWYRFYADYGPGHQSHSAVYRWFDSPLNREEKQENFEDIFRDREWPAGSVLRLRGLPADIKSQKIKEIAVASKEGKRLLAILKKTPITGRESIELRRQKARHLRLDKFIKEAKKRNARNKGVHHEG